MDNTRTFIMVKPDGVHRHLVGEVLTRFERKGLKLVAAKFLTPNKATVEKHYQEHEQRPFFGELVSFVAHGPVFCTVWEGPDAVKIGRTLLGVTSPADSLPGTIRGDFGLVMTKNIVHASSSDEDAVRECNLWFTPEEFVQWEQPALQWLV